MSVAAAARQVEADRQRRLVQAIAGSGAVGTATLPCRGRPSLQQGLRAYRINGWASAERALSAMYPTVRALMGETDFAALARTAWRTSPPVGGDLGAWGRSLPALIDASPSLEPWPFLADVARVDAAVHEAERGADQPFDAASLCRLAEDPPEGLALQLAVGAALIDSRHPVAWIWSLHQGSAAPLGSGLGWPDGMGLGPQTGWIWRRQWRGCCAALDGAVAAFHRACLEGASLDDALRQAGPGFDFGAWLKRALQDGWLLRVRSLHPATRSTS